MEHPQPKTLEEHREYLYEIVKLKLWFLHKWLHEHPEDSFVQVLRDRVDIYRKTDVNPGCINPTPEQMLWDDPAWQAMEKKAEAIYKANVDDEPAFEAEGFEVFRASLDARCERDMQDLSECPRYQCGFLRHNPEPTDGVLGFHIANFCTPYSFFDYPDLMKGCFKMLLDRAEYIFGVQWIGTGTWLNSMSRWRSWFPQEWTDGLGPANKDVRWHYGFWGQFITARKTFNFKYGKILRETGEFPFYPRYSKCTVSSMREHLEKM